MKAGSKFKFKGVGDEIEGTKQDIHFVVGEKPHHLFERKGDDLIASVSIPLKEALTGWSRPIKTIDDKNVMVSHGGPTPPNWSETYPGLGMVLPKDPSQRGNLIVKVNVSVIHNPTAGPVANAATITDCLPCILDSRPEGPAKEHPSVKEHGKFSRDILVLSRIFSSVVWAVRFLLFDCYWVVWGVQVMVAFVLLFCLCLILAGPLPAVGEVLTPDPSSSLLYIASVGFGSRAPSN